MTKQATIRVPTSELKFGMYVSKLDRPWLQTPFLFQGFAIQSCEDIETLKEHCEFVYVDKSLSAGAFDPPQRHALIRNGHSRRKGLLSRFLGFGRQAASNDENYASVTSSGATTRPAAQKDKVGVSKELKQARSTHSKARKIIREVMTGLRTGGRLELDVVQSVVTPMVDSVLRNNDALAWLSRIRSRDDYTYNHSLATSVYTIVLGRHLGYGRDELHLIGLGGLLLDVGKTQLSDELLKKSTPLTDAEWQEVRKHVQYGVEILEAAPGIHPSVIEMVKTHHERFNGKGYPIGIKGDHIPMYGQIAGLCDSFDAMTTERPYAQTLSAYEAMRQLLSLAGTAYKAELVEQFIQCVGMFPTGTLVELSSGEVGIVISQNKLRRLRPVVMVVLDAKKKALKDFSRVDLREESEDENDGASLWIRWGLEPGAYGVDPANYYL